MHEDRVFSLDMGVAECMGIYSHEMIEKVEKAILHSLQFKMNFPTSLDFI